MAAPMTHRSRTQLAVFTVFVIYITALAIVFFVSTSQTEFKGALQIFHFVVFGQGVLTLLSRYLWRQLVSSIGNIEPNRKRTTSDPPLNASKYSKTQPYTASIALIVWRILVLAFLVLSQISLGIGRLLPATSSPYKFVYISYSCLGIYAILLGVLLPIEFTKYIFVKIGIFKKCQFGNGFKLFAVVTVTTALAVHGLHKALEGPVVRRVQIPLHKLPESFHGMKVVQLSDIHLGPTVGRNQMHQVVKKVNELKPDLIVITGDLVEASVTSLAEAVEPVRYLKSRYGTYFSTGNHEYHAGNIDEWFDHLHTMLGVHCLHNENVKIRHKNKPNDWFYLVGTDDWNAYMFGGGHKFDVDKAMTGTDTDHATILLAHQPNAAKAALNSKHTFSLILSGHTHGGQFFPMNIFIYLLNPFYAGLYHVMEHTYVYVSSGTWYFGPPVRILSTPEITHITLLAK